MVYMFDFFVVEPAGNRFLLGTTKHRAKTRDLADAYGASMMRDVLFRDQKAAICVIKDQVGHTLHEVFADA